MSNVPKYFEKIKQAKVPDKFTYEFLKKTLGFNSGNDQIIVPVLKKLGFIDGSGIPLQRYRDFRVESLSKKAMGAGVREAYAEIFERNIRANDLGEDDIKELVKGITELEEANAIIRLTTKTFMQLKEMGDFTESATHPPTIELTNLPVPVRTPTQQGELKFTYTIVLNLPTTTSKEIYDTLFKSLKENLLLGSQ